MNDIAASSSVRSRSSHPLGLVPFPLFANAAFTRAISLTPISPRFAAKSLSF
jgi:hypothetical protein